MSNYKADAKEADRNRKRLMALIKQPGNNRCADCPARRELLPPACPLPAACVSRPAPLAPANRSGAERVGVG